MMYIKIVDNYITCEYSINILPFAMHVMYIRNYLRKATLCQCCVKEAWTVSGRFERCLVGIGINT